MQKNVIYLDNGATTKPYGEALEYAKKYYDDCFYNASALYSGGVDANKALKDARSVLNSVFGDNFEVIFTSCGSESDNTAVFSYARRGNVVTTLGEHSAIIKPVTELKNSGFDVRFALLNDDGSVNVENLLSLIDKNTTLVSVVHVNNETGAINDINKIAQLVKQINPRVIFHSDGVQAFLKIPYKLSDYIDLYSVSAHKINAIKGVGALIKNKRVKNLKPLIYGGAQEGGFRSGTENIFGIKIFEYAVNKHYNELELNYKNAKNLKELFLNLLDKNLFKVISSNYCSPYIISLSAIGLRGEVIQRMLDGEGVIIGTGSACSSKNRHSKMLTSIGYSDDVLDGVIRISFCAETTCEEVAFATKKLNEIALNLKRTMYNLK